MTFYNKFGSILVLRVRKNQIKNSNKREKMNIELSNPVISKLANDYVMSFLHHTGENKEHINATIDSNTRYLHADGFGSLQDGDYDMDTIRDLVYDWSHVRDSSDEAFIAMAKYISKHMEFRAKVLDDPMLIFSNVVANYFKELRREFDYYTVYEPNATSEIDRIDQELHHETSV